MKNGAGTGLGSGHGAVSDRLQVFPLHLHTDLVESSLYYLNVNLVWLLLLVVFCQLLSWVTLTMLLILSKISQCCRLRWLIWVI
ncbi:hypothetical protein AQUCO_10100009v1 [Aquilegia coerulea]|uniref:Uncharacterized protein n=1 Tax=Aquilegia coerulea TaxID=218851 RepID=A0A2G5C3Z8_AQUCA|nr:hypothetical protein AQUCO_10100009v1 [Aquilegia coerulea]